MWMPLVGPLPVPKWFGIGPKIAYVVGVRFAGTVLGNVFMWSGTSSIPTTGRARPTSGSRRCRTRARRA